MPAAALNQADCSFLSLFRRTPLGLGESYCLSLESLEESDWTGTLRIGVTSKDPGTLKSIPKHACPDLAAQDGFWARPIKDQWVRHGRNR